MIQGWLSGPAAQADASVATAATLDEAARLSSSSDVRLVIIDLQMPALNIEQLTKALRAAHPDEMSILAFAPHVHEESLRAAEQAGCDAVVSRGTLHRQLDDLLSQFL